MIAFSACQTHMIAPEHYQLLPGACTLCMLLFGADEIMRVGAWALADPCSANNISDTFWVVLFG